MSFSSYAYGTVDPIADALALSPFCVICNSRCKLLKSKRKDEEYSTLLAKILRYPALLVSRRSSLDQGTPCLERFVFCKNCDRKLQQIRLVIEKLEDLHRKVVEFRREMQQQIHSSLGSGDDLDSNDLLNDIRRSILIDGGSFAPNSLDNSPPLKHEKPTTDPNVIPQCFVKLKRIEDEGPVPIYPEVLIKQELQEPHLEHNSELEIQSSPMARLDSENSTNYASEETDEFILPTLPKPKKLMKSRTKKATKSKKRRKKEKELGICPKTGRPRRKNERRYLCKFPGCGFTSAKRFYLPKHVLDSHFQSPCGLFLCWRCGAHFPGQEQQKLFLDHEQAHVDEERTMYSCKHCSQSQPQLQIYPLLSKLKDHYRLKHPEEALPTRAEFPEAINRHLTYQEPKTCPHCLEVFQNPTRIFFTKHVECHTKPYKCKVAGCESAFGNAAGLRFHCIRFHPELKMPGFPCPDCDFVTNRPHVLQIHRAAKHKAEFARCTVPGCNFATPEPSRLKQHVERKHEGKRDWLCTECGKGFDLQNKLKVHMRTHTGEKPYTCAVCGKGFTVKALLKRHAPIHGNACPYVCELCGARFPTMNNLRGHKYSWHKGGLERIGVQPTRKGKYNSDLDSRT